MPEAYCGIELMPGVFDHNPTVTVRDKDKGFQYGAVQPSIRQILNTYFMEKYGLHSLQANEVVEEYLTEIGERLL